MSAVITITSDYINDYLIPVSSSSTGYLQEYLNSTETEFLYKLFGKTMADAFIADVVSGVPVDPLYLALYNPIVLDECYEENYSTGMKEMLKAFTYYRWFRRVPNIGSRTGQKVHTQTNSQNAKPASIYLAKVYNKAVANYKVIQQYIRENEDVYPDYDGQNINFVDAF